MWSDSLLADQRVMSLSWAQKGVFLVVMCVLRTQTDRPGWFIVNGKTLDHEGVIGLLKGYRKDGKGQSEGLRNAVETITEAGLIQQSKDGAYFSPRIVEEYETSEAAQIGGNARQSEIGHRDGHRPGHLEEEDRRKKESRSPKPYSGTPIDELQESPITTPNHKDNGR